jgi:thiol:disulfide interchange protein DsbC
MYRSALLALALLAFCTASMAGEPLDGNNSKIKETIAKNIKRLSPHLVVKSVRPLDAIPGLYEVQVGDTVFYSDASGEHMISGHIFETATRHDLTESRIEDINRIDWKKLPLKNAIVSGDPKGIPLAIFTDPDCPFCRHLEQELRHVKGVKIYTFLYPLVNIHEHARADAEAIWCAKDRHEAMLDIMLHDKQASDIKATPCKTPIDENLALGESLNITGTPTLIAGDGRKHAGGFEAEHLMQWLKNRL